MRDSITLGSPRRSALVSAALHIGAIALVLFLSTSNHSPVAAFIPIRDTGVYLPLHRITGHSSGGGGQHSPLPVPKGQPPKPARRVFTMPVMIARDAPTLLPMAPAVLAIAQTEIPVVDLAHIGSPSGQAGPMSGGPGSRGGIGAGGGPGAGDHEGAGIDGGSVIGGIGGSPRKNSTKPQLLTQTEPEYTEEARKAKLQGTVVLSIVIAAGGQVQDVRVLRGLGLGLDTRAADAVLQWRFRPAMVDGKPVATRAVVEVNFRLL